MKKITIRIISIFSIFFIVIFIMLNIAMNSVYYARNMPHKEGSEPELVMLLDNMFFLVDPIDNTKDLEFDMKRSVIRLKVGEKKAILRSDRDKLEYIYYAYSGNSSGDKGHHFSIDMELTRIDGYESIHEVDSDQLVNEIKTALEPTIERLANDIPIINLQWIFNLINYDYYN